mgnify:CR=1 FL=1
MHQKVLSMILVLVMLLGLLSVSAFTTTNTTSSDSADTSYKYNIMFLDCGRKYYSVDNIKKIIDNASAAGFNYIQLAVGNDGLRFLLDDMSLTVKGTTYDSDKVSAAIRAGNVAYNKKFNVAVEGRYYPYSTDKNELTQSEMDEIIAYAGSKGMGVIPCVNTPGHMDAILSAATSLTGEDCAYNSSVRTIDVTNDTAVAFTKALLQKYITYFAGKGCQLFNMGADEYANDIYKTGSMGFGNLQSTGKYSFYVDYVNKLAAMIKTAGMKPMAFNDGIYFANNTSSGTFDTDIIICYWSNGWPGYSPMPASTLDKEMHFKLINTNGSYYWVLGKSDAQCDANKASGFNKNSFPGDSKISTPAGSMFCIWADYPGAETEKSVISKTADTIAAFGKALPTVKKVETVEPETVTQDGVAVTAPGLTGLTVTEATAPTIDTAAEGKVSAYDVTPATDKGSYAGSGSVSLPVPEGWDPSRVRGYIVNKDGSVTTGLTGTTANDKFTFTVPHFSQMGIYELAANAATETKTINLTVGGTTTDPIDGEYPGTKLDDAVASVVGGEPTDKPGTTTYEPATLGKGTFYVSTTANDTAPTVQLTFENAENGQYYIKNSDGKYLYPTADYSGFLFWASWKNYRVTTTNTKNEDAAVKVETNNDGSIVISKTVTSGEQSTTAYLTLNGTSLGASENSTSLYLYQQQTTPGGKETTLTFTGKSVGNTSVQIGNVKYNIIVSDKAPDDALTDDTITLEHWITNARVAAKSGATGNDRNVQKISKTTAGIQSEDGVAVEKLAYTPCGYWGDTEVYYWQGMKLDENNVQTDASGDDETADGTTLTHIRYYGNAWQYKTADETWHYFQKTDQFVIYYLQKTKVTKEIDTYMKDWGYDTSTTTDDTSGGKGQVALTVAVVYPDGSVSPAEGSMYSSSTVIYNFKLKQNGTWVNRDIGIIAPKNNSDYNISKITVTDGKRKSDTSANVWYTTDSINWKKKTNVAGKEWYDETEVWNKSSGTTPMVNGKTSNITWSEKNTAKLVLIYLEPVEKETNLNVQYIDLNANNYVFHSYQVAMKYNQGDPEPKFNEELKQDDAVIGGNGSWTSNVPGTANYLPDDAYVINSSGTQQMFKKDITTIPEINGIYASGLYKYMKADISEDGKTLRLYYDLNATGDKTFVVDFGLPVVIPFSDFGIKNASDVTVSFNEQNTAMTERQGNYGNGKINMTAKTVTYTLTKTLDAQVPIPIYVTDGSGRTQMLSVNIIPATSVYYEDSFAKFTGGTGNAVNAQWTTVDNNDSDTTDKPANVNQALSALGDKNIYGHDTAYETSTKLSMGSAHKVTVSKNMYVKGDMTTTWPTATFTFRGTGFDVISLTDNNSGAISVKVYSVGSDGTETPVKGKLVNNYYGYTYADGKWTATPTDTNNALYQIPVIKIDDLTYGTYKVVITASYASYADKTDDGQYSFWLDAIRVYDPMGVNKETYTQDDEGYPQYIKLHDAIVEQTAGIPKAVFVDGGVNAKLDQYKDYGPNNEVYLTKDQAISFRLAGDLGSIASVQIGAKTPNGTGEVAMISVNGQEVKTATEMYYAITDDAKKDQLVTIANKGSGILSLTNLKITYNEPGKSVSLAPLTTADQQNAVAQVRALFAAPAEPFQPDRFEASWGRAVRKGDTATLTVKASEDVDSITVDGQTITTYDTKTERTGWGWWAKTVTYREFTYQVAAEETTDYTICAVNSAGVSSDPITATLTVRPSVRDWWHGIFDKWF